MQENRFKNYLILHFIVFIWGFTGILGALISLDAIPLVFYRMGMAVLFIGTYFIIKKKSFRVTKKALFRFGIAGGILALHWILFYKAIKVSNVSITMVTLSTGTFFASLLEPIFYKRKLRIVEVFLGLIVIVGLYIVNYQEGTGLSFLNGKYTLGILYSLIAAFLSALLAVIDGKLIEKYAPEQISLYQILLGVLILTVFIGFSGGFVTENFKMSLMDFFYLLILSSICTGWTFIESIRIMKYITPYTMMLTINLEPIYAIILALIIFKDQEQMNWLFYLGGFIILFVVLLNGLLKNKSKQNKI